MLKVNERCLKDIAQSNDYPTDHCGLLQKYCNDKKIFQKKWFVLKSNLLFYYNHKNDKEPAGLIILDGYLVEMIENSTERFAFKIDFGVSRLGHRLTSYILAAENQKEMEMWIKAISVASYDYLKMAVSELEHRLKEFDINPGRPSLSDENLNNDGAELGTPLTFQQLHEQYRKIFEQIEKERKK